METRKWLSISYRWHSSRVQPFYIITNGAVTLKGVVYRRGARNLISMKRHSPRNQRHSHQGSRFRKRQHFHFPMSSVSPAEFMSGPYPQQQPGQFQLVPVPLGPVPRVLVAPLEPMQLPPVEKKTTGLRQTSAWSTNF